VTPLEGDDLMHLVVGKDVGADEEVRPGVATVGDRMVGLRVGTSANLGKGPTKAGATWKGEL
jgi:hypothetical protein